MLAAPHCSLSSLMENNPVSRRICEARSSCAISCGSSDVIVDFCLRDGPTTMDLLPQALLGISTSDWVPFGNLYSYIHTYIHAYIYIYMDVCEMQNMRTKLVDLGAHVGTSF